MELHEVEGRIDSIRDTYRAKARFRFDAVLAEHGVDAANADAEYRRHEQVVASCDAMQNQPQREWTMPHDRIVWSAWLALGPTVGSVFGDDPA